MPRCVSLGAELLELGPGEWAKVLEREREGKLGWERLMGMYDGIGDLRWDLGLSVGERRQVDARVFISRVPNAIAQVNGKWHYPNIDRAARRSFV